ncbi:ubiquinone/menaquinone biosynthesis-related protein [Penicillium malachiteum]|uniref:Ubiquinone/menaquinone biosynthesis-related protein n=1 Tax=Penicillium malachiteum TaxID=1324776 RepID=A0AAD6HPL5_9EURO|nr:ubiquinone/menaquinone biosynthesis-related protein [Penicillium malachiteum]
MNTTPIRRASRLNWAVAPSARRNAHSKAQHKAPTRPQKPQRPSPSRRPPPPPQRPIPKPEPILPAHPNYKGPIMSPRLMTFLGVSVLGISAYCGFLYASYSREVSKAQAMNTPTDVSDRYNNTAPTFDAEVEISEKAMRMGSKRAALVRIARGDVLEVSCGTGRNLEYYALGERRGTDDSGRAAILGCRSLTLVDLSPQMVSIAEEKFKSLHPEYEDQEKARLVPVSFRAEDAATVTIAEPVKRHNANGQDLKGPYYDTIVQTMGLCSMPDPVGTLRHLGEITEPQNGRILLLEHGRSHYNWLNRILDNLAPAHADRHGCWWNRDIGAIVKESGLEIVEEKRWHFGTTWRYVLRPRQGSEKS